MPRSRPAPHPAVTVITGYHNRGRLLERTVDSVLSQTHGNFELIVFDDASTDDTRARLDRYRALGEDRLRVVSHRSNVGFTRGLIEAIRSSQGKYIAIQGSGDMSMPARLQKQVEALEDRPDVGVVGCYYQNIVESEKIVRPRKIVADRVSFRDLARGNVFSHGEVMFRRSLYEEVGGYREEFAYCQDYDLWLRMIAKARFFTVKEMLYKRFIQFDSASYDPAKFLLQTRFRLLCQRAAGRPTEEQDEILRSLRVKGPRALVDSADPLLQREVFRGCLRLIAWGNPGQATVLARELHHRGRAAFVAACARLSAAPLLKHPLELLRRALGIRRQTTPLGEACAEAPRGSA